MGQGLRTNEEYSRRVNVFPVVSRVEDKTSGFGWVWRVVRGWKDRLPTKTKELISCLFWHHKTWTPYQHPVLKSGWTMRAEGATSCSVRRGRSSKGEQSPSVIVFGSVQGPCNCTSEYPLLTLRLDPNPPFSPSLDLSTWVLPPTLPSVSRNFQLPSSSCTLGT